MEIGLPLFKKTLASKKPLCYNKKLSVKNDELRGRGGMVDATDLKSVDPYQVVWVQVPLPPSIIIFDERVRKQKYSRE